MITKSRILLALALAGTSMAVSTPAQARGCNGVVNWFVWGCAGWDNNNGAKYPYFKKHQVSIPASQAQVQTKDGVSVVMYQGTAYPLISQDGGGLVASGGGNFNVWAQN
jgi:hypothetical protein